MARLLYHHIYPKVLLEISQLESGSVPKTATDERLVNAFHAAWGFLSPAASLHLVKSPGGDVEIPNTQQAVKTPGK